MESRAQWAAKLLQEFQRRVEDMGIPGPHTESNVSARDSPAKKVKGKLSLKNMRSDALVPQKKCLHLS